MPPYCGSQPALQVCVEDFQGGLEQRFVLPLFSLAHDEPRRFDGMAGVDHAAVGRVHSLSMQANVFKQHPIFRFPEVMKDLVQGIVHHLLVERIRMDLPDFLCCGDQDHRHGVRLHAAGLRRNLGGQGAGRTVIAEHQPVGLDGALQIPLVAGRLEVLSARDDPEAFGEEITPLAQGSAVACDDEIHAPIPIEGILHHEVHGAGCRGEPFLPQLNA